MCTYHMDDATRDYKYRACVTRERINRTRKQRLAGGEARQLSAEVVGII